MTLPILSGLTLSNYSALKDRIGLWLERDDLGGIIPEFIKMVEERCNNKLRHPSMEETAALTLTSRASALPSDFLEMIRAYSDVNTRTRLEAVTPEFGDYYANVGYSNAPFYKLEDGSLYCFQSGATTVNITYYEKIPALSNENTSNWLMVRAPSVYLYGACLEATTYLQDDERAATFGTLYNTALEDLRRQGLIHKFGEMTMRRVGPTP